MTPEERAADHLFGVKDYVTHDPERKWPDPRNLSAWVSFNDLVRRYREEDDAPRFYTHRVGVVIASIKNTWVRRTIVVLTVAAIVAALLPLWLCEAVARKVREEFGEDIGAAWRGNPRG